MGVIIIDQKPLQVGDEQGSRIQIQIAIACWRPFKRNNGESDEDMSRRVQQKLDEMRVRLPPAESTGHGRLSEGCVRVSPCAGGGSEEG